MKKLASITVLVAVLLISVSCGGEKDQVTAQVMKMAKEKISTQCEILSVEVVTGAIKDDSKSPAEVPEESGEVAYTAQVLIGCGGNRITLVGKITRNNETGELDYSNLTETLSLFSD